MTRDTRELEFAQHRQMFLTEQGYSYAIADESELMNITAPAAAPAATPTVPADALMK